MKQIMNKLTFVLKRHPIISYGVIVLLANLAFSAFQFDYDLKPVVTILTFLLPVLAFPYWFVQEMSSFSYELNMILGLLIFALLELLYQMWLKKARKPKSIN